MFAEPEARDGVVSGGDWPAHECFRTTAPGLVEVWPLIEVEPAARADGWQLPDQQEARERGETRLAQAIARQIFAWLRDRTPLPSTGQPIRAGDIMILLPRRGILQELLIRELKRLHVPVAGADRLALTDDIAVMDLIALGDVLLLPEDDLSLRRGAAQPAVRAERGGAVRARATTVAAPASTSVCSGARPGAVRRGVPAPA